MTDPIEKEASFFPKSVRVALNQIGSKEPHEEATFAILSVLFKKGGEASFNEIVESSSMNEDEVDETLDNLQTGGVVKKNVGEIIGDSRTGNYEITDFGYAIFDGIYKEMDTES